MLLTAPLAPAAGTAAAAAAAAVRHALAAHAFCTSSSAPAGGTWTEQLPAKLQGLLRRHQRSPRGPPERLQPGLVSPLRGVPAHIPRPEYAAASTVRGSNTPGLARFPEIHDHQGRAAMRAVGQLAAAALRVAGQLVAPGVTTDDIDAAVHEFVVSSGAYPSPLLYHGFPKSVCTSVNEVMCHGIPDARPLRDGDIINIDVTVFLDGYHGDTNAMFLVGRPPDSAVELVEVTRACLDAAVRVCGPGVPFRAIGGAIADIADAAGMSVSKYFVGHGIGRLFHAAPAVLHHRNWRLGKMCLHQTFTIEPSLTLGSSRHTTWRDGWTAVTADGCYTAQWEHTVLVTEDGVEVLTQQPQQEQLHTHTHTQTQMQQQQQQQQKWDGRVRRTLHAAGHVPPPREMS